MKLLLAVTCIFAFVVSGSANETYSQQLSFLNQLWYFTQPDVDSFANISFVSNEADPLNAQVQTVTACKESLACPNLPWEVIDIPVGDGFQYEFQLTNVNALTDQYILFEAGLTGEKDIEKDRTMVQLKLEYDNGSGQTTESFPLTNIYFPKKSQSSVISTVIIPNDKLVNGGRFRLLANSDYEDGAYGTLDDFLLPVGGYMRITSYPTKYTSTNFPETSTCSFLLNGDFRIERGAGNLLQVNLKDKVAPECANSADAPIVFRLATDLDDGFIIFGSILQNDHDQFVIIDIALNGLQLDTSENTIAVGIKTQVREQDGNVIDIDDVAPVFMSKPFANADNRNIQTTVVVPSHYIDTAGQELILSFIAQTPTGRPFIVLSDATPGQPGSSLNINVRSISHTIN